MDNKSKDFIWLYKAEFAPPRKQIGSCQFSSGSTKMTELKALSIFRHKDDSNVYLLYEFINGSTDSYLDSVEKAMEEAEDEFGVKSIEWKKLT